MLSLVLMAVCAATIGFAVGCWAMAWLLVREPDGQDGPALRAEARRYGH